MSTQFADTTPAVRFEAQILPWLLAWGSKVRVMQSESLRQLLAAEGAAIVKKNIPLLT